MRCNPLQKCQGKESGHINEKQGNYPTFFNFMAHSCRGASGQALSSSQVAAAVLQDFSLTEKTQGRNSYKNIYRHVGVEKVTDAGRKEKKGTRVP